MFGRSGYQAEEILTTEQLNNAMYVVFYFRADVGLEYEIMYDMMWFDPMEWSMCSFST